MPSFGSWPVAISWNIYQWWFLSLKYLFHCSSKILNNFKQKKRFEYMRMWRLVFDKLCNLTLRKLAWPNKRSKLEHIWIFWSLKFPAPRDIRSAFGLGFIATTQKIYKVVAISYSRYSYNHNVFILGSTRMVLYIVKLFRALDKHSYASGLIIFNLF